MTTDPQHQFETLDPNDHRQFRQTLGRFPSGLVVLTATYGDRRFGLTCQAFSSVSLDPPLVSAFLTLDSGTLWAVRKSGKFAVSVLAYDQIEAGKIFALSGADKFRDLDFTDTPSGAAIVGDSLAWLQCDLYSETDAGDHVGLLGEVTAMGTGRDVKPLVYWRGAYGSFE